MTSRFIQIHALTSFPGTLLNRDDAGFAKRLPFGGAVRTRVSSQCLKRHWRTATSEHALSGLDAPDTFRSRHTFERLLVETLATPEREGVVRDVVGVLMNTVLGSTDKGKAKDKEALKTGQITVLGAPEVDYLKSIASECLAAEDPKAAAEARVKDRAFKDNLKALTNAAGLTGAMFGRMVTSDMLARCDAAVHVAHALTVHEHTGETDYFAAVDDLPDTADEGHGSGHIGTTELASGLYYVYVVVDVPLLVSNLTGAPASEWQHQDRTLAAATIERLIHLIATVSPGAKLGSTAPYAYAHAVLVETGDAQPRTLANAFLRPVQTRGDVFASSLDALARHIDGLDRMYGSTFRRRLAAIEVSDGMADRLHVDAVSSLADVSSWAAAQVSS